MNVFNEKCEDISMQHVYNQKSSVKRDHVVWMGLPSGLHAALFHEDVGMVWCTKHCTD